MTNIYNLFQFIKNKEKKEPSSNTALKLKLKYAPEKLTPEDLTIEGNLDLSMGDTKLPDNLDVKGSLGLTTAGTSLPKNLHVGKTFTLNADNLKELPDDLHIGEDFRLYSKSLEKLPDNLRVPGIFRVAADNLKFIPANLQVDKLVLQSENIISLPDNLKIEKYLGLNTPNLTSLPSNLEVRQLELETEKITALPSDLKANSIHISRAKNLPPSGIPENLRSKIVWNGGTFQDFATYMELPAITVPGYSEDVKARKVNLKTVKDLPEFQNLDDRLPELLSMLQKQPIKNFEVYNIYQPGYGGKVNTTTQISVQLPQLPAPIVLKYRTGDAANGQISYKNKSLKIYTFESDIANRGLDIALGRLVPGYAKQVVPKHLQDEKGKALRLSQIIDREQKPVSMDLGKKKRAGLGVKGQYKDYALAFSPDAQNTLINLGKRLGVEWKDFIAYRHNDVGDPNYVVKGEAPNGEVFYVNKFGSGQGSSTKVYDKNFSQV